MRVRVHVTVRDKEETFEHELRGESTVALRRLIDYYEGKAGTVKAVYNCASNVCLFREGEFVHG